MRRIVEVDVPATVRIDDLEEVIYDAIVEHFSDGDDIDEYRVEVK